MKHMKTVYVPETNKKVVDHVDCDLCKQRIQEGRFEVDEVTIKHSKGTSYPEGGCGETVSVDICGKCFTERLTPWLKSQGAELQTEEWDF